jgi:hypothetical protein
MSVPNIFQPNCLGLGVGEGGGIFCLPKGLLSRNCPLYPPLVYPDFFGQSLFFECAEETKSIERRETGGASCLFKGTVLRDFLAHHCQFSLVPTLLSGDRVDGRETREERETTERGEEKETSEGESLRTSAQSLSFKSLYISNLPPMFPLQRSLHQPFLALC